VLREAERTGATDSTPPTCSAMLSTSSREKLGTPAMRGPKPAPGMTMSRLLPMLEIWSRTAWVVPWPRVTIVMTADTPMMTPSTVRKARVRLRRISRRAMRKAFQNMEEAGQAEARELRRSDSMRPSFTRTMRRA